MWVGTANGLNYFDHATGRLEKLNLEDGLINEVINGICIDSRQNLWISSNKGITRYSTETSSFHHFDESDGLQGKQFIHGAYFRNEEGMLFFGGINGLNYFHPDSIKSNQYIPPVFLTDFMIFYKEVEIGTPGSPLQKSITLSDKITLSHNQ